MHQAVEMHGMDEYFIGSVYPGRRIARTKEASRQCDTETRQSVERESTTALSAEKVLEGARHALNEFSGYSTRAR